MRRFATAIDDTKPYGGESSVGKIVLDANPSWRVKRLEQFSKVLLYKTVLLPLKTHTFQRTRDFYSWFNMSDVLEAFFCVRRRKLVNESLAIDGLNALTSTVAA